MSVTSSARARAPRCPGPRHAPRHGSADEPLTAFGWLKEIGIVIVLALVTSALVRAFVVQVFWIPSPSMHNTLIEQDRIAVSRFSALTNDIHRGDVIVFHDDLGWLSRHSAQPPSALEKVGQFIGFVPGGSNETLVKRVIAVGGDHVSCVPGGKITINGVEVAEPYIADGQAASQIPFDVTVPEGALWVMGDNRGNSQDSRYHMGEGQSPFVSVDSVTGTVSAIVWPIDRIGTGVSSRATFSEIGDL